jgi:hypothetical protein
MSGDSKVREQYARWNARMKEFLGDMTKCYGKMAGSKLASLQTKFETFTMTDPARAMLADMAWPMFNKHRDLIEKRDTDVLFKYDLAGLQSTGGLDFKVLWNQASANNKEAIWRAVEDLLDILDELDALKKKSTITTPTTGSTGSGSGSGEKKSPSFQPWHEVLKSFADAGDGDGDDEDDDEDRENGDKSASEFAKSLMGNLKDIMGNDGDEDFERLMSKLSSPDDGKTTPEDQETMSRILHHFINKFSPAAMGNDEDDASEDMSGKSEAEKAAAAAKRELQEIHMHKQMKHALSKLMQIDALKSTDPSILEADTRENEEETERLSNPNQNRDYTITAHFNHKVLLFLNKLLKSRGSAKSKRDGRLMFPWIKTSLAQLLSMFKENPGSEEVIRPVGVWVVEHRERLLQRDDSLFMEPDHPFLKEINSAALWATWKPHERVNFWTLIGHPLQLATIFHHLDNDSLRAISDIVNDLLAAGKISYDRDPSTLNRKQIIHKAIERGCTSNKITKIRGLFEKMRTEKDKKTLKALAKLLQDVIPQAAGLRTGVTQGRSEEQQQEEEEEEQKQQNIASKTKSASSILQEAKQRSVQMETNFEKILAAVPLAQPTFQKLTMNPPTNSSTTSSSATTTTTTTSAATTSAAATTK